MLSSSHRYEHDVRTPQAQKGPLKRGDLGSPLSMCSRVRTPQAQKGPLKLGHRRLELLSEHVRTPQAQKGPLKQELWIVDSKRGTGVRTPQAQKGPLKREAVQAI